MISSPGLPHPRISLTTFSMYAESVWSSSISVRRESTMQVRESISSETALRWFIRPVIARRPFLLKRRAATVTVKRSAATTA